MVDMTQWTFVDTDHHQFVVGTRDADTLSVRQSGALLEVTGVRKCIDRHGVWTSGGRTRCARVGTRHRRSRGMGGS